MKTWFLVALVTMGLGAAAVGAEPEAVGRGSGREGALTVTEEGTVINRYAQVTGPLAPGDTAVLVDGTRGFSAGDLVMVLQTTGLVPEPAAGSVAA